MKNNLSVGRDYLLSEVSVGIDVEVVDLKTQNQLLKRRLLEMGITKGVCLTIKRIAPLGSPVSFMVRGYELGLRKDELESIIVRLKR